MACFKLLTILFGLLALFTGTAMAGPVRQAGDFNFKSWLNRDDCPEAGGTKYNVLGKTFGILCGWDTHSRTYHWAPFGGIDFSECIQKCVEQKDCTVATFTGTCYLKKNARGKGFIYTGKNKDMTAIKLLHKNGN